MNKFELINTVLQSTLNAEDKTLLIELIMRADDEGKCWPSVERLCKARGMKHEKNFKGADFYLPGLVTKTKNGRKNTYYLNVDAIEELSKAEVAIKHTPSVAGVNTPSTADDTPSVADNTPSVAGANSTSNNTKNNTEDNSRDESVSKVEEVKHSPTGRAPAAPGVNESSSLSSFTPLESIKGSASTTSPLDTAEGGTTSTEDSPSTAGVSTKQRCRELRKTLAW